MAVKRKSDESYTRDTVHSSRQNQISAGNPNPVKRPRRQDPNSSSRRQAHGSSINDIKKRIRDVKRKLARAEVLSPNVRVEDERALAAYEFDLAAAEAEKTRQKMISKYHMVRFFERKKAERQLKQLRKRLIASGSPEEVEALKAQLHIAEVDLNYTQYAPLSEIYISLYPAQKEKSRVAGLEEDSRTEDPRTKPPMWLEVEKSMENGTLIQLRNRPRGPPKRHAHKLIPLEKPSISSTKLKKSDQEIAPVLIGCGMNRRERRHQQRVQEESRKAKQNTSSTLSLENNATFGVSRSIWSEQESVDEDSDGGFFDT